MSSRRNCTTRSTKKANLRCRLIQATDDANNAPVSTDWSQWKAKYKGRSPLFANIIECFRESSVKNPGTKVIHDLVNRRSKKVDWTPLHWAVYSGRVDAIKTLVSLGADPFILSDLNTSIIHAGAESKKDGGLAGALKIWKNYPDKLSINQLNRWGETALHLASWSSSACVKLLLEAGAAADIQEENGQVPLHCAGLSGRGPTRLEVVSLLCATNDKSHINIQDLGGRPPLFDLLDDPECIEILLRNGAKLSLTDTEGNNAFHHVCIQNEPDSLAILLRLAEDEADAVVSNDAGNTPLMEAILNTHVACAIQILGLKNVGGTTYSKEGWAPIHYAAKMGDVELLSAVLKHNSFVKGMKTIDGRKAEFIAMEAGTWEGEVKRLIREYDSLDWID